jgi:hypothetical protein
MSLNCTGNNYMEVGICNFIMTYSASSGLAPRRICGMSRKLKYIMTVLQLLYYFLSITWNAEKYSLSRGAIQSVSRRN